MLKKYNQPAATGQPQNKLQNQPQQQVQQLSGEKLTPQQQQLLNLYLTAGRKIIREAREKILAQIGSGDPIDGIATTTVQIVIRLEKKAIEAGQQIDPGIHMAAANLLMGEIIQLYEQSGGQKLSDEQRYQAYSMALSIYLDDAVRSGKITKDELQQMSQMMQQSPDGAKIAQQLQQSSETQQPPIQNNMPPSTTSAPKPMGPLG